MFNHFILQVIDWFRRFFNKNIQTTTSEAAETARNSDEYERIDDINITAILANKLTSLTISDSTINVTAANGASMNPRADYLNNALARCVGKLRIIASRVYGTGGVILKPWVLNGKIHTDVISQDRFYVIRRTGDIITSAGFIAEVKIINQQRTLVRLEEHTLDADGTYHINQRALVDGIETPLASIPEWAEYLPKQNISGVTDMLFAFLKCPTDQRKRENGIYGVPITYGCEKPIKRVIELISDAHDEYMKKRTFIGADETLFRRGKDNKEKLPESGLYKLFHPTGDVDKSAFWEVFSPEIRSQAYIDGINYNLELIEKAVGVNRGVLTDMVTENATATAIKQSSGDTFSLIDAMRGNIESSFKQLVYAYDVYANAFGLAPQGDYEITYDWDYSMRESSSERWTQLVSALAMETPLITPEEARSWLMDEDIETALENIPGLVARPAFEDV